MRASSRSRFIALAASLAFISACTGTDTPSVGGPYVLALQADDVPDGLAVVSPAVLGSRLALRDSGIALHVVTGDPTAALARAVHDDAALAVVVAPFTTIGADATQILAEAHIPVLTFSALDPAPVPSAPWRRFVPDADAMVDSLVSQAITLDRPTCVLSAEDPWASAMGARLDDATRGLAPFVAAPTPTGCVAAIWSGPASGAASVRAQIPGPLLLADQARTDGFLEATGPRSGSATFGFCGCADLTASVDPEQQAFVHAYQETSGLDPGPFAAEGFDAGTLLLLGVGEGSLDRQSLVQALAAIRTFDGVAGSYVWSEGGTLAAPPVRMYRAEGVRWLAEHRG